MIYATVQTWTLIALAIIVVHMLMTLIQAADLWWAWKRPNRRSVRYFRRARRHLLLTILLLVSVAAFVITTYIKY